MMSINTNIFFDDLRKAFADAREAMVAERDAEIAALSEPFAIRVPYGLVDRDEVADWCAENCTDRFLATPELTRTAFRVDNAVYFASLQDAALFKLVFL